MSLEVSKIIVSQLKAGSDTKGLNSGIKLMMCWGYKDPKYLNASKGNKGGLMFNVSGLRHTGTVWIVLNSNDTYTITIRDTEGKTQYSTSGIYHDSLTDIIDSYVESNAMGHHD